MIECPIKIKRNGEVFVVKNKNAFVSGYEFIFNKEVKAAIFNATFDMSIFQLARSDDG